MEVGSELMILLVQKSQVWWDELYKRDDEATMPMSMALCQSKSHKTQ